jgi:hypothetical protein
MGLPIQVKEFRVRSLDIDVNALTWELEDTSEDLLDYTFQVQRSESPSGPFDLMSVAFQDTYSFTDNTLTSGHRWRKYWYQLFVKRVPTGDTATFGPVTRDPDPDLIALELRRHMQLLFREFAGRRCWVMPVRTFGQRCSCYNQVLKSRTRSGCALCYDTGFVRGYLSPIESWVQMDPSAKSEQNTNVGAQQQSNTTARLVWYPPLKPRDLIVEPENRRWRVVQVNQTEQGRAAVHQEVQLHEVPPRDIEFKIPLNLQEPLKDLWLNPSRNYYNPQSLESFMDAEIPSIFSLYQSTYSSPYR